MVLFRFFLRIIAFLCRCESVFKRPIEFMDMFLWSSFIAEVSCHGILFVFFCVET